MQIGNKTYYSKSNFSKPHGCLNNVIYYNNGRPFRKIGPTEIFFDSSRKICYWSKGASINRIDGPAVFDTNYKRWYFQDYKCEEEEYWNK